MNMIRFAVTIMLIFVFCVSAQMTVKDSDDNVLMQVNDESTVGSMTVPSSGSAPSTTTNKLYNVSGALYWNGSELGTAGSAGGWTDNGTVVRLSTSTDKVGIGDNTPTYTLDVGGKIGINDYQVIYLPDQSYFGGTLYIGNGGLSLTSGEGMSNTAVGWYTMYDNTTGSGNTALGYSALRKNTEGDYNTICGNSAMRWGTTGDGNTAFGFSALEWNTGSNYNVGIGMKANSENRGDPIIPSLELLPDMENPLMINTAVFFLDTAPATMKRAITNCTLKTAAAPLP